MKSSVPSPDKSRKSLFIKVTAVVVVILVVGVVIAVEYPHLVPKKVQEQSLSVYTGPSGPVNSDHLLGGCVIAEVNTAGLNTSKEMAMDQFAEYMLSPQVQFPCESATGFIPISPANVSEHITTLYTSSSPIAITYFTSISPSDFTFTQKVVNAFNAKYTNIKVTAEDEVATSIITDVEADVTAHTTTPIVISIDNLDVGVLAYGTYSGASYLLNMNNTVTGGVKTIMPSNVIPSIVNLTDYESSIFAGSIPFVTQIINTPLVWVDATALKEAGITTEPNNYSALLSDAKILDKKFDTGMINVQGHGGASTATELYQIFVQFGGNPVTFNSTNDVKAMYCVYNLSAYFSPEYKTSYWATYKGLASNKYSMMDYQWPGSVDLSTVGMNTTAITGNNSVLNVSIKALSEGVFIRDPVSWISEWQILMDEAWSNLIVSGHSESYSSISTELASMHTSMFNYLEANYNYTVAEDYNNGMYKPIVV